MSARTGSLFTGTGALDLAVMDVYDAEMVWHSQYEPPDKNGKEDKNQYAAKILARHWPDVPNLGDITKVDWRAVLDEHGPIDILTGGFPCQDVSSAGRRVGLNPDSRSGLWAHMARAVAVLQPKLVVIENVEGLLSAPATSGMEPCPDCVGDRHAGPVLRACGAVLGDLAALGLDAEWGRYGANEVGAPHRRRRIIIRAWPASLHPGGLRRRDGQGLVGGMGAAGRDAEAPADTADLGHERGRDSRDGRTGPADTSLPSAHPGSQGLEVGGVEPDGPELPSAERSRREPAADSHGVEPERRGVVGGQAAAQPGQGDQRERAGNTARDSRADAAEPACPTCGCGESFHDAGGFCAGCHDCTDPELGRPGEAPADTNRAPGGRDIPRRRSGPLQGPEVDERETQQPGRLHCGSRAEVAVDLRLRPGDADLDWGPYGPAIRRWERILGRRAPWPTDAVGRLSPVFTEWLMGLPEGWVTDTPGLTRSAMLRALGNGVVWQQAAYALRVLHERAAGEHQPPAA